MSARPKHLRTKPRKKLEDRRSITAQLVYEILRRQPRGANGLSADDPALLEAVRELAAIQVQAHRHERSAEDWRPSKERNAKIVDALRTLTEELPSLNGEMEWAVSAALEHGSVSQQMIFEAARRVVADLTTATNNYAANELLASVIARANISARWELFAKQIMSTLRKHLPQLPIEGCYRVLMDLIPDITGETPDDAAAIKKQYLTVVVPGKLKLRAIKGGTKTRS